MVDRSTDGHASLSVLDRIGVWALTLGSGLCLGVGGYTFLYARGFSYLLDDPAVCVNCHVMQPVYDGWQKSSHHAAATCNDCHTPHNFIGKYYTKAENGFHHSKAFTLQNFHEPIRMRDKNARIVENNCLRCHGSIAANMVGSADAKGERPDCIRCHSGVGHGPD